MKPKVLLLLGVFIVIIVGFFILRKPGQSQNTQISILHTQSDITRIVQTTFNEVQHKYSKDCYLVRLYSKFDVNGNQTGTKKWYLYFSCPNLQKNLSYKYANAPEFWQEEKYHHKDKLEWKNLKPLKEIIKVAKKHCDSSGRQEFLYSLKFDKTSKQTYWRIDCSLKEHDDIFLRVNAETGERFVH